MGAGHLWLINWFACAVLAASALSGCNLLLDNEKRSLRTDSIGTAGGIPYPMLDGSISSGEPPPPLPPTDGGSDTGDCTTSMACMPGEAFMAQERCGSCMKGTRSRQRLCTDTCQWGKWDEWSECEMPEGLCKPGDKGMMMQSCGACDKGVQKAERTCTDACTWGNWSMSSCVIDEALCEPGSRMEMPAVSCDTMCGKMQQTRVCSSSCQWGAVESGECEGQGECLPGATRMVEAGCNPQYCNKGVQKQQQKCTQVCTWGAPTNMGNCDIPMGEVCRPKDLGSTMGYRCIQGDPGFGEVCQPSTASEALRCTYGARQMVQGC